MGLIRFAHRYLARQTPPSRFVKYYDRMIDRLEELYLLPYCRRVCDTFPGPARILDVGCGTGQLPVMLAQANRGCTVVGVDLSKPCLAAARVKAAKAGVSDRVEFVRGAIERGGLERGAFDLVISTCSLHHWRHPVRVLKSAVRLLKPSGQIWIVDHTREGSATGWRDWMQQVEQAACAVPLFRIVFRLETRFLSYSRCEVECLCKEAGVTLAGWEFRSAFFLATIHPPR